jgi:NAD(P)-dependent dehydrogenase (short-subunit alcohol dehydrogenase family)
MNVNKKNNGKTALITGGSRGIGLGISTELAKAGFDLVINGIRDKASVNDVLVSLNKFGGEVIYLQGDISSTKDRMEIINKALSHYGHLNILVNNAGVAPLERKDILEAAEESFDRVMTTNLKGPYFLTQQIARHMINFKKENPSVFCCIINISSISASVVSTNRGEYCISKAGIAMATKLWAARLGEYDIPVYEIQPGIIWSDMTSGVSEKYNKLFKEGLAVTPRWGLPEDVGKAAVSLCLGLFPYSTGQVIMVDGGMTIPRL